MFLVFLKLVSRSAEFAEKSCKICFSKLCYMQLLSAIWTSNHIGFCNFFCVYWCWWLYYKKIQPLAVNNHQLSELQPNYSEKRNTSNSCKKYSRNICSAGLLELAYKLHLHGSPHICIGFDGCFYNHETFAFPLQ